MNEQIRARTNQSTNKLTNQPTNQQPTGKLTSHAKMQECVPIWQVIYCWAVKPTKVFAGPSQSEAPSRDAHPLAPSGTWRVVRRYRRPWSCTPARSNTAGPWRMLAPAGSCWQRWNSCNGNLCEARSLHEECSSGGDRGCSANISIFLAHFQ